MADRERQPGLFDKAPRPAPTDLQRALRRRLGVCEECGQYLAVPPSPLCARCETAPPADEEPPQPAIPAAIAEIPIPRLPRGGMDWREYQKTVLAAFQRTEPARRREFRRVQETNLRLLHDAAKDLWTDLNMEMADFERGAQ